MCGLVVSIRQAGAAAWSSGCRVVVAAGPAAVTFKLKGFVASGRPAEEQVACLAGQEVNANGDVRPRALATMLRELAATCDGSNNCHCP
jgi:hypothetical protein